MKEIKNSESKLTDKNNMQDKIAEKGYKAF